MHETQAKNAAPRTEVPALVSVSSKPSAEYLRQNGELLARAFVADPVLCHAEPNAARRAGWMSLLYRGFLRYAAAAGGVELSGGRGLALWLQSEMQPPFLRGVLYGSLRIFLSLGWRASWRCLRHEGWCEARVRALGFRRFGYLWVLGVDPVAQRSGYGRHALAAALAAMRERQHEVCLLKTETAANVPYYQALGFEVVDEAVVPATQLRYWLFRRQLS